VHRRLVEECEYGGADIAPAGSMASVMSVRASTVAAAPRAVEPSASGVALRSALGVPKVVVDPIVDRIVLVVRHV
jgi:hypothetical protein